MNPPILTLQTQDGALPDPRLTYRYFIQEVETRVGPQKHGLGVSQTFPWIGKLSLRDDIADASARVARQRYENEKLRLFFEIKDNYYEYYYLGRAIDVVRANFELVKYMERVAQARYKTASTGHPDVIRAQVEMGKLEDTLHSFQDRLVPVVARLNASLHRPTTTSIPRPTSIPNERLDLADEALLSLLTKHNPTLLALDQEIDRARQEVAHAGLRYYPDVTIGLDYTNVGQAKRTSAPGLSNPAAIGSAARIAGATGTPLDAYTLGQSFLRGQAPNDSGQDIWMVSLSMNLPIWRESYASGEREAQARYQAAIGARTQSENKLVALVQRTLFEHRDAGRKITLYRANLIPKARESIRSTETAFRSGSSSFLDMVDAERSLLEFELAHERALADRAQRLAQLEMLVGRTLPRQTDLASAQSPTEQGSTQP
jgi:outer membrane protein TolC